MDYGLWTENSRSTYNKWDGVARCTTQVKVACLLLLNRYCTKRFIISNLCHHNVCSNFYQDANCSEGCKDEISFVLFTKKYIGLTSLSSLSYLVKYLCVFAKIINLQTKGKFSFLQVFPGAWTAILVFLDNPGIWNLRAQNLDSWYLGQETYVSVVNPENSELPVPANTIFCGALSPLQK